MQKHLLSINHSRLPTINFYMEKQFPVDSSGPMRESFGQCRTKIIENACVIG